MPIQPNTASPLRMQTCTKLVMDTTDPDITFDENGVCNHWHEFRAFEKSLPDDAEKKQQLETMLARIKQVGKGKKYDCLIGLSGGVDSSYLAWLVKDLGLRPLAIHFDNGWDTELAVSNIEQLVSRLGIDYETFVMDWTEFRDLQRAYFKASVIDLEIPTDHMIFGALYRIAAREGIRYILSGHNTATEWLLPRAWIYSKFDYENVKGIHNAYGEKPIEHLPALGVNQYTWYHHVKGIRMWQPLDLVEFDKAKAKQFLMDDLGWRDYGGKHHESIFTRFYQGYVLPRKFDVDKRKAHLSNLILVGQLTREEAMRELQQPTYDEDTQQQDKQYVAKKLGFSDEEFEAILTQPNRAHEEFGTDKVQRERYMSFARRFGKISQKLKSLMGHDR